MASVLFFAAAVRHIDAEEAAPVFANGADGYSCFRIPAIVRTRRGALLAFAEARRNNCNDFGDVRIVMRRSNDNGRTWGQIETVAENGALQAGNPAPVMDAMDRRFPGGRLFLVYCTGDAPEDAVMRGEGTRRVWFRTSSDDGGTWSQPAEITASVKPPAWRHYATGPGHALQLTRGLHKGRLFVAANHSEGDPRPQGHDYAAHAFYSDDHGATWHLGATVDYPGSNESTAAQDEAGEVVMNIRDQSKKSRSRILAVSENGGAAWDKVFIATELPDPVCEGSMTAHGKWLLFSNAASRTERRDLTVSVSADGGRTWPKRTLVAPGPAAYSDLVLLPHRRLGVLWERGNSGGIVFAAHPLDTLTRTSGTEPSRP